MDDGKQYDASGAGQRRLLNRCSCRVRNESYRPRTVRGGVPMRIRGRQVSAGLGVASLLWAMTSVVAPTAAGASTALCGATITVTTTLTEDVGPCPSDGITIGASNVTLNLGGHTVF